MSAGITISGGGGIAVDTPAMQAAARSAHAAATALDDLVARLGRIGTGRCAAGPGGAALDQVEAARMSAIDARSTVDAAARGLATAAQRYGAVEQANARAMEVRAAAVAGIAGTVVGLGRRAGVDLQPVVLADAAIVSGVALEGDAVRQLLTDGYVDPFTDPADLAAVGRELGAIDDYARGVSLRETPAKALADDPADPDSTEHIAARLAAGYPDALGIGLRPDHGPLQETPHGTPVARPADLAELGSRIPDAGRDEPQVRIEGYRDADGRARWIVYLAGTATFAKDSGSETTDQRSNLDGVAGTPMQSEVAAEAAMRRAGITPTDPVLLIGHSQGALIASRLAAAHRFAVQEVVTLGGPTGRVVLPASIPVLAVEHTDDLVPKLDGDPIHGAAGQRRIVVTRQVYDRPTAADLPDLVPRFGTDVFVSPAHQPAKYVETLGEIDRSSDARIREFERRLQPFLTGGVGARHDYRLDRIPDPGEIMLNAPGSGDPTGDAAPGR